MFEGLYSFYFVAYYLSRFPRAEAPVCWLKTLSRSPRSRTMLFISRLLLATFFGVLFTIIVLLTIS